MPIGRGNAPTLRVQTSIIKKNQRTCNDADGDLRDQLALEGMALADRLLLRLPLVTVGDTERGFIARIRLQLDLCGLHVHSQVNLRAYGQGDLSAVSGPDCTDSTAQEAHCAHPCHRAKLTTTGQSSTSLKIDPYRSVSNQASTCLADTGSTLVPRRSHEQPGEEGSRTRQRNWFAEPLTVDPSTPSPFQASPNPFTNLPRGCDFQRACRSARSSSVGFTSTPAKGPNAVT